VLSSPFHHQVVFERGVSHAGTHAVSEPNAKHSVVPEISKAGDVCSRTRRAQVGLLFEMVFQSKGTTSFRFLVNEWKISGRLPYLHYGYL
jgi:hypothetical protein